MNATMPQQDSVKNIDDILVVGDWFVDEYWFVVRHHSEISSHIKPYYYRIFTDAKHIVRDLCGGGFITRVLYELREYEVKNLSDIINKIEIVQDKIIPFLDPDSGDLTNKRELVIKDKKKIKELKENNKNWNKNYCSLQAMSLLNETIVHFNDWIHKEHQPVNKKIENRLGDKYPNIIHEIQRRDQIFRIENPEESKSDIKKQYRLFGLGRWNPIDDNILEHFIHARCQTGRTVAQASFSLKIDISSCGRIVDVRLDNLEQTGSTYGTTRCIRAYRYVSGRFKQLHRIDWEQAPNPAQENKGEEKENNAVNKLFEGKLIKAHDEVYKERRVDGINKLAAVIVDDHTKGVITENLIKKIKDKANKSNWFVRTKDNRIRQTDRAKWPSWLGLINSIELLVVGPEISCRCYPINGLLTEKDRLAEHAYELIRKLIGTEGSNGKIKNVVLTSDKLEVVAYLGGLCFIARPSDKITKPEDIENIDLVKINWTTAFFAALTYEMLITPEDNPNGHEKRCEEMIGRAIKNAHEHSGVRIPQVLEQPTDESCREPSVEPAPRTKIQKACDWEDIQKRWKQAKSKHGIIDDNGRHLDIWRPSTDLPGFIVCIEEKREAIRRIWQKINSFIQRQDPTEPLSILLEADPAVGKTFLAESLAEVSNCELVKHDITQMIERTELLDLFNRVADAQARSSKPVFVFVDEINATLGGSPVYGAFLSPLESGKYVRNGQYIQLKPCIWMFAGTPDGDSRASDNDKKIKEKRNDFETRMTMIERIDYTSMCNQRIGNRSDEDVRNEARLEQVYLGAKRINNAFNDVKRIDHDILKVFYALKPELAPARLIKRLASSLENVQYGQVHKGNCTSLEWQKTIRNEGNISDLEAEDRNKWNEPFGNIDYVDITLR